MKSISLVLIAAVTLLLVTPAHGADAPPYRTGPSTVAPRPYNRAYMAPLPYRVYRPVYRPYAHGGKQGPGYVWGFPYRGFND